MDSNAGPEAYFASLLSKEADAGPETFFAAAQSVAALQQQEKLGCHHGITVDCDCGTSDEDGDMSDEGEELGGDSSSDEEGEIEYAAPTPGAYPELAIDTSVPLEAGIWRKLKKGAAAAARSYRKTGKEDRANKAKDKELLADAKRKQQQEAATKSADVATPASTQTAVATPAPSTPVATPVPFTPVATPAPSTPLAMPTSIPVAAAAAVAPSIKDLNALVSKARMQAASKLSSSDPTPLMHATPVTTAASTLPIASKELVSVLGKLIHRDINTSLPELASAVLSATDINNVYYANLALPAIIGQLRLAVESRLPGAMDMRKLVDDSRTTSVQKSALDTKTFEHLRNVMAVFASELNTMCTCPGEDGTQKAINHGANMGREFVTMLDRTYLLGQKSELSAAHPVVRLGAMLTSLLNMTQARATHQTEINAAVRAAVKPVWSAPLTKDTFHEVIRTHFE